MASRHSIYTLPEALALQMLRLLHFTFSFFDFSDNTIESQRKGILINTVEYTEHNLVLANLAIFLFLVSYLLGRLFFDRYRYILCLIQKNSMLI